MIINLDSLQKVFDYLSKFEFNEAVTLSFQPPKIEIDFKPGMTFQDIEREHQEKFKKIACQALSCMLAQLDDFIREKRKRGAFHNVNKDDKKMLSWCGEVPYNRTFYTDSENNSRCLCDEVLGLDKGQTVSLDVLLTALILATEGGYVKTAKLIEKWTGVRRSPETIRRWVLRVGAFIEQQEKAQRFLMFKNPSLNNDEDRRGSTLLFLEADGCYIYIKDEEDPVKALKALIEGISDEEKKKGVSKKEVRLGLWYEGKRPRRGTVGNDEWEVTGKTYFGGFMGVDEFWELATVLGEKRYGLGPETMVLGGGDGALWVGPHFEDFARVIFVLCRYHWKRDIFRIFPEEKGKTLIEYVESNNQEKTVVFLDNALQACQEKHSKKKNEITKLKNYLLNNWQGIQNYSKLKEYLKDKDPALARIGVIEGHIYQMLYLRFESRGGCWSIDGVNSLFRVLTAKMNDTLETILKCAGWKGLLQTWVQPEKSKEEQKKKKDAKTGCIKGEFPILRGPVGKPIAQVLKGISHPLPVLT